MQNRRQLDRQTQSERSEKFDENLNKIHSDFADISNFSSYLQDVQLCTENSPGTFDPFFLLFN